jgi:ketosteroid isomerase-like protein
MSQENVETLRRCYAAFNRRDFDELLCYVDPQVEMHAGILAPDQNTRFLGREGYREFLRGAIEAWESVAAEPKEIIEAADNRILAVDRWLFRGRDGIEIERELPTLYTFRDGLVVGIDGFTDKAEALEAAGLSE